MPFVTAKIEMNFDIGETGTKPYIMLVSVNYLTENGVRLVIAFRYIEVFVDRTLLYHTY